MEDGECGIADKGYQGAQSLLTPVKGKHLPPECEYWNNALATVRIHTERVNGAIKNFEAFSTKWRGEHRLHRWLFVIICSFLNVQWRESPIIRQIPDLLRPTVRTRLATAQDEPLFERLPRSN